ncbi:uncharacterized protein LOC120352027 [Nilaparvata lugens]|uniref:uncharacterized protein LOC120352027 n=1 Tax=Nilaparvata lugens TaxID=108931 RepID=UPI00193E4964|nr:uncharacterized protein LOC120352027 [Nilaparvata lugens]
MSLSLSAQSDVADTLLMGEVAVVDAEGGAMESTAQISPVTAMNPGNSDKSSNISQEARRRIMLEGVLKSFSTILGKTMARVMKDIKAEMKEVQESLEDKSIIIKSDSSNHTRELDQ